jgi:hypothetical protein
MTWEAISTLLSPEAKLCTYYLEELWNEDFQRALSRLRESFIAKSREHSKELARQKYLGETSLFARLVKEAEQQVSASLGSEGWRLPPRVVFVMAFSLVSALLEDMSVEDMTAFSVWTMDKVLGKKASIGWKVLILQYASEFMSAHDTEDWFAEIKMLLFVQDLLLLCPELPEPPLRWLPIPLPRVPKPLYLEHVESVLKQEVSGVGGTVFLKEFSEKVGFQFPNLRVAIPAVLSLAEGYYDMCAACYKRYGLGQVSSPNDETLRRYAKQVYLRVVRGETWGKIMNTLFGKELEPLYKKQPPKEQREQWKKWRKELKKQQDKRRVRVRMTTKRACEILGIPHD